MKLEEAVGSTLAALCRIQPPYPEIREMVLAATGLWVPDGQDLIAYIEANAKSAKFGKDFVVETKRDGVISGVVSYSRRYTVRDEVTITTEQIRDVLSNSKDRYEAAGLLEELAFNNEETDTDYDYSDTQYGDEHDDNEEEGDRSSDSRSVIDEFLDENPELDPELDPEEEEDAD